MQIKLSTASHEANADTLSAIHRDASKQSKNTIKKHLNDMKEGEDITFDQLLLNLNVTEENYLLAVMK